MTRTKIAVAATGRQALRAGLDVAEDGGSAVDAALAAALVALATEPGMVSFGGGAYISVWPVDGDPVVIDGSVEMPGRGLPPERFGTGVREVRTPYGGGLTMHAGHASVATPGITQALQEAHRSHARLDWSRLLQPAIDAARHGYPMSPAAARYLSFTADSLFGEDEEAHRLVTRADGTLLDGGEMTSNPALADTLDQWLVDEDLFVRGEVARAFADDMAAHGGLVTAADLESYAALRRTPHLVTVGEWEVATNPPPAVGGPMLAIMLAQLAERGDWTWADAIEIQRAVLGYRLATHDYSEDLDADGRSLLDRVGELGLSVLRTSPSTAHISAVDDEGNACAITMSSGYGAGMCIPGTGILLNNTLGEVELNRRGLHAMAPGTRLASNMAPTTARAAGGRALAIGSPGADRITTALMLVLGQHCLHDADLATAIADPRLHLRLTDQGFKVEHEQDPGIATAVERLGLPAHVYDEPHMYFGGVGAARRNSDGTLTAAGDSRREAEVGVSAP